MHPSGYQLAASFIDKIQIHHILHDSLRKLKNIELRNAYLIKYSKGGQYFFAIEKQTIFVYNAYTFTELKRISIDTPKVFNLVFADLDKAFAVVGANGYLGRWKLPSFEEFFQGNGDPVKDKWCDYKGIDFVKEPREITSSMVGESEPFQLAVVGTDER
jgi:hypothetical protein